MQQTRSWRGRLGAALSLGALAFAITLLASPRGRPCPADGTASLDLTPLLLFALATAAIVFDVQALRRGDRLWARIGLVAVSVAEILGIWGTATGFLGPGCG